MHYALIDESGRIYDHNDKILIFAVLVVENLSILEKIIIRARQRIPKKGKRRLERLSEIKFSLTGDKTRLFILKELAKQNVKIYVLVVNKQGRKIKDDPTNYSLLIGIILKSALADNSQITHIFIDRHFTFITQRERLNTSLRKMFDGKLFIEHVDSLQNSVITLADFVAGAIRFSYVRKDNIFRECIKNLIVEEKLKTWREIKSGKS